MRGMRRRQGTDEPGTVPNARPLKPDQVAPPPEDVFASFVERSYRHDPVSAAKAEQASRWERSVEELLEQVEREDAEPRGERDTDPPPPPDGEASDAADPSDAVSVDDEAEARDVSAPPKRDEQGTVRVVLLTQKKSTIPPPHPGPRPSRRADASSEAMTMVAHASELRRHLQGARNGETVDDSHTELRPDMVKPRAAAPWASAVEAPSEATQRREAKKLVPDLSRRGPRPMPPSEASEDGLVPGGELDRQLTDMAVLLRYGHEEQVAHELEGVRTRYARDLLLLRRIAEFWAESGRTERALESLFALASGLFERRNVEGMRQTLEQALALDPHSERAQRLLSLLDQRPSAPGTLKSPR